MAKESHSVEILPTAPIDIMCGSINYATFRVTQTGRNIVGPKVKQSSDKGRDPKIVKSCPVKWRSLSKGQIQYWQDIAEEHNFYSRWTAFVSSFFLSVDRHGLDYTLNNELSYLHSENRLKKQETFENSRKRRSQFKADPMHYLMTAVTLMTYPLEHACPLIYIRLLDLVDVNNALRCRMVIRTDPVIEYDYYSDAAGDGNTGTYIRKQRPRTGDEVFELFNTAA